MRQASERTKIAQEVLDTHAENLKSEFSTFEELQDLFIDIFGNDIGSSEELAGLQNQFANGTLRPEVKFVSSEVLTDDYGNIRDAAFDREHQTILLSEDLDAAGIESSILQEIGHWWDVLLNGNQDTVTEYGKPFDEGTAYAERFSEGAKGDNIFSNLVYQNDSQTILVNGQETEVEFRPIATWNINRNTNRGNNTLQAVLDVMENPGPGIGPIEVMALQEVTPNNLRQQLEDIPGVTNFQVAPVQTEIDDRGAPVALTEFFFERNGTDYRFFYNNNLGADIGNAIVLRNPPERDRITPFAFSDPEFPRDRRGYLAVETPDGIYYSVHAQAGFGFGRNTNNNADNLIYDIRARANLSNRPAFILGDFNRDIAFAENRTAQGAIDAFPEPLNPSDQRPQDQIPQEERLSSLLRPANIPTFNAREAQPSRVLDYMFTEADLLNSAGTVLNQLPNAGTQNFPSDHFPVLYDDEIASFEGGNGTVRVQQFNPNLQTAAANPTTAPINEQVEFTSPDGLIIDLSGNGRSTSSSNRISFTSDDSILGTPGRSFTETVFQTAEFNGYVLEFDGLRTIESVRIDELTNRTGIAPNDIDITFDSNTINVNLEGLLIPRGTGFELVVDFANTFPDTVM